MTRKEFAELLSAAPEGMVTEEESILKLEAQRRDLEFALQMRKNDLLCQEDGPIQGKNAEIRAAQLSQHTLPLEIQISEVEQQLARHKAKLRCLQAGHHSLLMISNLLAARDDFDDLFLVE